MSSCSALARNGKKVLHFEKSGSYGSTSGTYNVGDFFALLDAQKSVANKSNANKTPSVTSSTELKSLKELDAVDSVSPFLSNVVIGDVTDGPSVLLALLRGFAWSFLSSCSS